MNQPATPPAIAPFDTLRRFDTAGRIAWASNYDMRFGEGELVYEPRPDEEPGPARSVLWMADHPARPLDFTALSAIADAFIVRIFHVRGRPVPAGTGRPRTWKRRTMKASAMADSAVKSSGRVGWSAIHRTERAGPGASSGRGS